MYIFEFSHLPFAHNRQHHRHYHFTLLLFGRSVIWLLLLSVLQNVPLAIGPKYKHTDLTAAAATAAAEVDGIKFEELKYLVGYSFVMRGNLLGGKNMEPSDYENVLL